VNGQLWPHVEYFPAESAFFDKAVQRILERCPVSDGPHGPAWPVAAFFAATDLYLYLKNSGEDFAWFYHQDPAFCAELLRAITLHYDMAEIRPGQIVAKAVAMNDGCPQFDRGQFIRTGKAVWTPRPKKSWDALAEWFWEQCGGGKKYQTKGDTLRKSIWPHERNRRRKIIQRWDSNIRAWLVDERAAVTQTPAKL
jgi:hypothetical protein